jgi:7-cyano-7-deazaguanine synthase
LKEKPGSIDNFSEAVCIFSGGLDSISTATYLKKMGLELYLISFDYGQRASHELLVAKRFSKLLKSKKHEIINISFLKTLLGKTNILTGSKSKIPSTFDYSMVVPLRNTVFLTLASVWATSLNISLVIYGAHCRPSFTRSLEKAHYLSEIDGIKLGIRKKLHIWSPAMDNISKSELLLIGYEILGDKIFQSWSCYLGSTGKKTNLSKHCGICESCMNRKQAVLKAGLEDKTNYVSY